MFFRVAFGLLMAANVVRYELAGWVDDLYVAPLVRFPYWGFEWLPVFGPAGMHAMFAVVGLSALAMAAGYRFRLAAATFVVSFSYLELIDRTNYLNHYYLVSLLALLLVFMPLERGRQRVPSWCVAAIRLQLTLVYFFAGVAKLRIDWLVGAPLSIWLRRHIDLPLVGSLMDEYWLALAMSWAGLAFDLAVGPCLWFRRTRPFAYAAVVAFHLATASLFPIGAFPWLMIVSTTVFFAPSWPRDVAKGRFATQRTKLRSLVGFRDERGRSRMSGPSLRAGAVLIGAHFLIQALFPLRHLLYEGRTEWHEQGFRFSWNVMVAEKFGMVEFRVVTPDGATSRVHPSDELTPLQMRMMQTQPDMILSYAHHLARRWRRQGLGEVAVYADAFANLNGRRRQRFIDPEVNLAAEEEGFGPKRWILPLQEPDSPVVSARRTR
ncbi:MAG: HTTM domain-containing protein [Myxococcota bacterium]